MIKIALLGIILFFIGIYGFLKSKTLFSTLNSSCVCLNASALIFISSLKPVGEIFGAILLSFFLIEAIFIITLLILKTKK